MNDVESVSAFHCANHFRRDIRESNCLQKDLPKRLRGKPLYYRLFCGLCLSEIKSGHIRDAIRRVSGGKEYALPSLR
jgi:hypothetical protein